MVQEAAVPIFHWNIPSLNVKTKIYKTAMDEIIFQLCSLRWSDAVMKSVFWLSDFASEKPMKHSIIAARQARSSKHNLVGVWACWSCGCKLAGMLQVGQWYHTRVSRMEAGAMAVWLQPSSIPFLRRVWQLSFSHYRLVGNLIVG